MEETKKSIIILDANAFISMTNIKSLGVNNKLITTADVIEELKDAKTKAFFDEIPFDIEVKHFDEKSLNFIKQFAKKTGDIGSLSDVDLQLIALAHTLYLQNNFESKIRKEPLPLIEKDDLADIANDQSISEQESESDQQQTKNQNQINKKEENIKQLQSNNETLNKAQQDDGWTVVPKKQKRAEVSSESDEDNEEGWITPKNYDKKIAQINSVVKEVDETQKKTQQFSISLVSSDFSIQNVVVQMGISLLSLDGRRILSIRRFIWQCYLCWKQYKITDNKIKVCTQCGYNSLSKIAYSIDGNGNMILHRKKGWKPNQKVLQWKQRKLEEQQKNKKHQHARRKKKPSIFQN